LKINNSPKVEIMGVVNLTPDSFWSDSRYKEDQALEKCLSMSSEGARWIDIGAESTRPNSTQLTHEEEWERLERLLPKLENKIDKKRTKVSIDTYHPENAIKASDYGVDMINDPLGIFDNKMIKVVTQKKLSYIANHSLWPPKTMQEKALKKIDVLENIKSFFLHKIKLLKENNVNNYYLDPGIGFGKTQNSNVEIINNLKDLKKMNQKIAIGVSRKSLIGELTNKDVGERLQGSLFVGLWSVLNGTTLLRVHDVKETVSFMDSWGIDCSINSTI